MLPVSLEGLIAHEVFGHAIDGEGDFVPRTGVPDGPRSPHGPGFDPSGLRNIKRNENPITGALRGKKKEKPRVKN